MPSAAEPDVPPDTVERVAQLCLTMPGTTLRSDRWAHAFEIRRKPFAWLLSALDSSGASVVSLVVDADPHERQALLSTGHPYFAAATNERRLGIVIDDRTDWTEIRELVTDSYRLLAPKKLSALLDD